MRTPQEHRIDRAIARTLGNIGDYMMPQTHLRDEVGQMLRPHRATEAEIDDAIHYMESQQRILGVTGETGTKWKLTETGRAWRLEHGA